MNVNKAVFVDPRFPPREIAMDRSYDSKALLGCKSIGGSVPSYFSLFTDRETARYRAKQGLPDTFDSSLSMVYDDDYLKNSRALNKICSDLYSACRKMPWPILGTAIIEHCSLDQLRVMYDHIPVYLALDPRIEEKYKRIILSRDASAYAPVLENIADYY